MAFAHKLPAARRYSPWQKHSRVRSKGSAGSAQIRVLLWSRAASAGTRSAYPFGVWQSNQHESLSNAE